MVLLLFISVQLSTDGIPAQACHFIREMSLVLPSRNLQGSFMHLWLLCQLSSDAWQHQRWFQYSTSADMLPEALDHHEDHESCSLLTNLSRISKSTLQWTATTSRDPLLM